MKQPSRKLVTIAVTSVLALSGAGAAYACDGNGGPGTYPGDGSGTYPADTSTTGTTATAASLDTRSQSRPRACPGSRPRPRCRALVGPSNEPSRSRIGAPRPLGAPRRPRARARTHAR